MQITPLTPTLGAQISGVDIRRLDAAGFDKLRRIWLDYKVIFLREQDITLDELQQFSQHFGALLASCTRPELGCRFKWTPGSIVVWDNRSTLHYAVNDYDDEGRCLYRTTVAGAAPLPA